jgi:hypothetical protein
MGGSSPSSGVTPDPGLVLVGKRPLQKAATAPSGVEFQRSWAPCRMIVSRQSHLSGRLNHLAARRGAKGAMPLRAISVPAARAHREAEAIVTCFDAGRALGVQGRPPRAQGERYAQSFQRFLKRPAASSV